MVTAPNSSGLLFALLLPVLVYSAWWNARAHRRTKRSECARCGSEEPTIPMSHLVMCERCARITRTGFNLAQWVCVGMLLLTGVLMLLTQFIDTTRFIDPLRLWGYMAIFGAGALSCWLHRRLMG